MTAERTGPSTPDSNFKREQVIPVESHLVREYRERFDNYYTTRYCSRPQVKRNIALYLMPFMEALGFTSLHEGPRYIKALDDVFETTCNLMNFVVYCKEREGKSFSKIERRVIVSLAASAFLFTLGHDETSRYLAIEREYVFRFEKDIDRARIYAKEAYLCFMSRMDQYLTTSPITPIKWMCIEEVDQSQQSTWYVEIQGSRSQYIKTVRSSTAVKRWQSLPTPRSTEDFNGSRRTSKHTQDRGIPFRDRTTRARRTPRGVLVSY